MMVLMAAFMLFGSLGASASEKSNVLRESEQKVSSPITVSGEYTSSCGVVWNYTVTCTNNCSTTRMIGAIIALFSAAEDTCEDGTEYIEFTY